MKQHLFPYFRQIFRDHLVHNVVLPPHLQLGHTPGIPRRIVRPFLWPDCYPQRGEMFMFSRHKLRSHSFAMYTKEYDVFTGDLKQRFDETRLRNEEDEWLEIASSPPLIDHGGLRMSQQRAHIVDTTIGSPPTFGVAAGGLSRHGGMRDDCNGLKSMEIGAMRNIFHVSTIASIIFRRPFSTFPFRNLLKIQPRNCQDAYLKKMRSMVGGSKMKKLLYPGGPTTPFSGSPDASWFTTSGALEYRDLPP